VPTRAKAKAKHVAIRDEIKAAILALLGERARGKNRGSRGSSQRGGSASPTVIAE